MSLGPRTVVDVSMCGVGATPKVGYTNKSGGATPPCHVSTFSRTCSDCRLSLLISLRTRRCMQLMERLERCRGLFLDSASTLFFGGGRSSSGELPKDNSSSAATSLSPGRMGSLPLFYLTEGARWLFPHAFSPRSSSKRACRHRCLAADGQHSYAIQPSVWPALLASFPYLNSSEETGPQGTDLLGCWSSR